jgi:hypothetical protein
MRITLVYLGNPLPDYFLANLEYIESVFPEHKKSFISDMTENLEIAMKLNFDTFKCPSYQNIKLFSEINLYAPYDFRNGFWFHTFARFIALAEYQNIINEPLLHVEGDVVLLPSFPFELLSACQKIAFPLVSLSAGAASILFLPSAQLSELLTSQTLEIIRSGRYLTDMGALAEFATLNPENVEILPTFNSNSQMFRDETERREIDLLSKNFEKYMGFFDALSFGQFFLGEDPRNNWGKRLVYKNRPGEPFLISNFQFRVENNRLFVRDLHGMDSELFSLHVHSKDIRAFNPRTLWDLLGRRAKEQFKGEKMEIIDWKFLPQFPNYLIFKLRAIIRFFLIRSNLMHHLNIIRESKK